jgi:hypothetical protein
MRGVLMYAPGDIRVEDRDDPRIVAPSDQGIAAALTPNVATQELE